MRPESETLLRMIGDNYEIGTHASMLQIDFLALSIKNRKISETLIGYHGFCATSNLKRENYLDAVVQLAPYFNQMSVDAFGRILYFSQELNFISRPEFIAAVKAPAVLPAYWSEQLEKRAMLIQGFPRLTPPAFTKHELKEETQIKEKFPWRWIDAMERVDPKTSKTYVIHVLGQPKADMQDFLVRMPSYLRHHGIPYVEEIIAPICGKLSPEDLEEITQSFARRKRIFKQKP